MKAQKIKEILEKKESATEETLQSIASTLKRIEKILTKDNSQSSDEEGRVSAIKGITVNLPDLATHGIQQEVKESE